MMDLDGQIRNQENKCLWRTYSERRVYKPDTFDDNQRGFPSTIFKRPRDFHFERSRVEAVMLNSLGL